MGTNYNLATEEVQANLEAISENFEFSKEYVENSILLLNKEKEKYISETDDIEDVQKTKIAAFDEMINASKEYIENKEL